MTDSKVTQTNSGIGCLGFAFLILLTVKLTGIGMGTSLSWWWVFSPLILGAGLLVVLLGVLIILALAVVK